MQQRPFPDLHVPNVKLFYWPFGRISTEADIFKQNIGCTETDKVLIQSSRHFQICRLRSLENLDMHQKSRAELCCDEKLGGFMSWYSTDSNFGVVSLLADYSEVTQVGKINIQPSCL